MNMKSSPKPARLEKKKTLREKITDWFYRNLHIIFFILIIISFILFFLFLFFFVPATESGTYYNRFGGI